MVTKAPAFVAAPRAFQVTGTLVPEARPPSLKLISVSAALVGVREASAVLANRPMFTRAPFGSGSVQRIAGSPASINGESSPGGSKTKVPLAGLKRPAEL